MTNYQEIYDQWQNVSESDWNDWHWQLSNSVTSIEQVNKILSSFSEMYLSAREGILGTTKQMLPIKITPHSINALREAFQENIAGAWEAFRWSYLPCDHEYADAVKYGDDIDGIGEELQKANPVPAVTNFYKNRVVFRVTSMCASHCRFCFRRRMIGDVKAWDEKSIVEGLEYIKSNNKVHEVILSGGDPLTLADSRIEFILSSLNKIQHIRRIRIDTKTLATMPQRFTEKLISLLQTFSPIYIIPHFCHAYELSQETQNACMRLARAGIQLASHTPLLSGINDNVKSLAELFESLVDCCVRPYYLIQFIPTHWTEHYRVPISKSLEILKAINAQCSGLAIPKYIVYLPDAGGKVPVVPSYIKSKNEQGWLFENLNGRLITYPEP